MKNSLFGILLSLFILSPLSAHALYTELGLSYSRKNTTFDKDNDIQAQSATGSISFYFGERIALELSYTDAMAVRHEKASPTDEKRTIVQKTQAIGSDLIFVFADKTALFQPFVKAGAVQLKRSQEVQEGTLYSSIDPETAIAPSYGLGIKIKLTESFGIKATYSIWQTPLTGGGKTNDDDLSAGITWMF